ncbi:hypothetical protein U9M48_040583 [Paspalum notatum var. saurae]|uniref:Uncharacterized protein n=1 Tax=Paspalum notatum var. saurae TaxID=547442 RepID=A0AAQ3USN9_PASNO
MSWPSIPAPPFSFRSSLLLSPTALVQISVLAPALRSSSLCGSLGSRQLLETVTATRCSCWTKAEDLLLLGILSRQQIVSLRCLNDSRRPLVPVEREMHGDREQFTIRAHT